MLIMLFYVNFQECSCNVELAVSIILFFSFFENMYMYLRVCVSYAVLRCWLSLPGTI